MSDKPPSPTTTPRLSEDWLAVILAFGLILLAALGVLGETGLPIRF
jgi:hypothetical protein